jgi:aminopeptidase YwaD
MMMPRRDLRAARPAVLLAWIGVGCSGTSHDAAESAGEEGTTAGLEHDDGPRRKCPTIVDPLGEAALAADIGYLGSDALGGRAPGTAGDRATLDFIDEQLGCIGLDATMPDHGYRQTFVTSAGDTTANIVGILPGNDPRLASEIVVVGAHHDHLGTRDGKIYNGANDNASGVAAVLAIARSLTDGGVAPRRTIAFVTFGFEEHDGECEGSEYFVAQPPEALPIEQVVYMFDLDMLGSYPSEGMLTAYGSFDGTPAHDLLQARMHDYPQLSVDLGNPADEDASDFQAFCDVGIPYLYFETWDLECYHRPCDDPAGIDYPSLSAIVRLSADVLLDLADSDLDLMSLRGAPATGCPAT